MNVRILIDGVMRQTTVLIAQLATSGGLRAPLAHVAGQVFLDLSKELESQGLTKKVTADMFGMALRTYQRRTQRLAQSATDRGRSLWEALLEHIQQEGVVTREQLFKRFRYDDEMSVRGVLRDLAESGILFASGVGASAVYRVASKDELGKVLGGADGLATEALIWSLVFRNGPVTAGQLAQLSAIPRETLEPALAALTATGRVETTGTGDAREYRSTELVLGFEDPVGWEAAVLDHFTVVVRTIASKLGIDQKAHRTDQCGGSTYHFTIFKGHPLEDEVLGELARFRKRMSGLRDRVNRHNAEHGLPGQTLRVDAYYGQQVLEENNDDSESDPSF